MTLVIMTLNNSSPITVLMQVKVSCSLSCLRNETQQMCGPEKLGKGEKNNWQLPLLSNHVGYDKFARRRYYYSHSKVEGP